MYSTLPNTVHDFPRQAVSIVEKEKPEWIKQNMDFFDYQSTIQEIDKVDDMRILRFLNGEIDSNRFRYVSDPLALGKDKDEEYGTTMEITHFPIVARPINTIVGECIKRPLNFYAKSESAAASNEYFRVKTDRFFSFIFIGISFLTSIFCIFFFYFYASQTFINKVLK